MLSPFRPYNLCLTTVVLLVGAGACANDAPASEPFRRVATVLWLSQPDTNVVRYRDLALVNGEVWLLAQPSPFVHRYSSDGQRLGTSVLAGDGPGEVRLPNWIVPAEESADGTTSAFLIHRMQELVPLGADGKAAETYLPFVVGGGSVIMMLEELSYGEPKRVRTWRGIGFVVQQQREPVVSSPTQIGNAVLLLMDTGGAVHDTIVDLAELTVPQDDARVRTFIPIPVWGICGSSSLAVYSPRHDAVRWYSPGGEMQREVVLGTEPRAITSADRQRFVRTAILREARGQVGRVREMLASVGAIAAQMGPGFAKVAPPVVRVLCDDDGTAWLQMFDTDPDPRGYGREWLVIGPDGRRQQVLMPGDFHPRVVRGGALTGWMSDEDGVQQVARVVVPRP
jgi:hypothetical protein